MNVMTGGTIETGAVPTPNSWSSGKPGADPTPLREWEKLKSSEIQGSDGRPSLRIRMDAFLLQRAIEDPAQEPQARPRTSCLITRGKRFSATSRGPFFEDDRWLARDLGRMPRSAEFWHWSARRSTIRQRAEQAALAAAEPAGGCFRSEQIYPWIKAGLKPPISNDATVKTCSSRRKSRLGRDPTKAFGEAARSYDETVDTRCCNPAALCGSRPRFAILPDYSLWLAHRYPESSRTTCPWRSCGRRLISYPTRLEKPGDTIEVGFHSASKVLAMGLDKLEQRFKRETSRVETERSKEDWEVSTAASAVPFADSSDDLSTSHQDLGSPGQYSEARSRAGESSNRPKSPIDDRDARSQARGATGSDSRAHGHGRARARGGSTTRSISNAELGDHASTLAKLWAQRRERRAT